jgi:hypothetical protein
MITATRHAHCFTALACAAVLVGACASRQAGPAPAQLRDGTFALSRVDGHRVRGVGPQDAASGSRGARFNCQDQVADGVLLISRDGRTFTYRSSMRDCSGRMLLSESNEGMVESRDDALTFLIHRADGTATFRGTWTDSTVTVFELGGLLEFARR